MGTANDDPYRTASWLIGRRVHSRRSYDMADR